MITETQVKCNSLSAYSLLRNLVIGECLVSYLLLKPAVRKSHEEESAREQLLDIIWYSVALFDLCEYWP